MSHIHSQRLRHIFLSLIIPSFKKKSLSASLSLALSNSLFEPVNYHSIELIANRFGNQNRHTHAYCICSLFNICKLKQVKCSTIRPSNQTTPFLRKQRQSNIDVEIIHGTVHEWQEKRKSITTKSFKNTRTHALKLQVSADFFPSFHDVFFSFYFRVNQFQIT